MAFFRDMRLACTLLASFLVMALILTSPGNGLSFPQPTGYVNDFAGVIDDASKNALEGQISAIESNSGTEIAVVTVLTLQNATVEEYAVKLFETWGIGKRGSDNGLLILVAPNEREWKIEVGYGLEGDFPDAKTARIGRECFTDNFTAGQYGAGLQCAVAAFGGASVQGTGLPYNIEYWQVAVGLVIFIILVIVTKGQILVWMLFIAKAFGFGGGRSGGGGGSGKW